MKPHQGSLLILTFMLCVMLILEVTLINGIVVRSYSEEGMLRGQNIMARRGLESALAQLEKDLYASLSSGASSTVVWDTYKRGGTNPMSGTAGQNLMAVNPETSTSVDSDVDVNAWIQEVRGSFYHLVARARVGGVDLLSHKWVNLKPCLTQGVLSTIVSGVRTPGFASVRVDSQGRVMFAEGINTASTLWTWKDGVLSTVLSGIDNLGYHTLMVDANDRFYIGSSASALNHMYTWKDNALTTITSGGTINGAGGQHWQPGFGGMSIDAGNRFYFAGVNSGAQMFTWKNNVFSTILNVAGSGILGVASNAADRVFFHRATTSYIMSWSPATGLSTSGVVTKCSAVQCYAMNIAVDPNGKIDFGDYWWSGAGTHSSRWVWSGNTLSTLIFQTAAMGDSYGPEKTSTNHYFTTYAKAFVWNSTTNTVSTLSPNDGAMNGLFVSNSGRAFLTGGWDGNFYTWAPATVLSTVSTGLTGAGAYSTYLSGERAYFGENNNPGKYYTYSPSTGLSTIASGLAFPGKSDFVLTGYDGDMSYSYFGSAADVFGRVVFSEDLATTGALRSWQFGKGMTTILTGRTRPGVSSLKASPAGGFYFGENSNPGNFYFWKPPDECSLKP